MTSLTTLLRLREHVDESMMMISTDDDKTKNLTTLLCLSTGTEVISVIRTEKEEKGDKYCLSFEVLQRMIPAYNDI